MSGSSPSPEPSNQITSNKYAMIIVIIVIITIIMFILLIRIMTSNNNSNNTKITVIIISRPSFVHFLCLDVASPLDVPDLEH